jgi:hypothetical protein
LAYLLFAAAFFNWEAARPRNLTLMKVPDRISCGYRWHASARRFSIKDRGAGSYQKM